MAKIGPASEKQKMILESEAEVLIIGGAAGSGKSYLLQMLPLKYVDDPKTACIMFRKTMPQLTGQGGLIDTARDIYETLPTKSKPVYNVQGKEFKFPNGATVRYRPMELEKDKYNYQGLQYTMIGFDEGTQFNWTQIEYLMSRMRSASKYPSRMVISCNPDPDHEIRKMINWWLDTDGYPIPERDGVIRWFFRPDGDEYVWADTKEELMELTGCDNEDPTSFSFISATIYDNPPMLKNNPKYLSKLKALNAVDKAQLLYGNWDARPKGASYFERDWLSDSRLPAKSAMCRAYDLAATERSQVNKFPDFTSGIKMHKDKDGYFYIVGDYVDNFYDDVTDCYGRMCKRVGERDNIIIEQAKYDGEDTIIVFPVDPSAAGKQVYTEMAKKFQGLGFRVKKDAMPTNKSKLTKFLPFADACENGLIRIVRSTFTPATYEALMKELEAFNGERSTSTRKDDLVDAVATAYNYLCKARVHTAVNIPRYRGNGTALTNMRKTINSNLRR